MNLQYSGFKTTDEYLARIFGSNASPKAQLPRSAKMLENVKKGLMSGAGKLDQAIEDLLYYGRLFENSDRLTITRPKLGLWADFLRLIFGSRSDLVVYQESINIGIVHSLRDAFNVTGSYDKIATAPLIIAGKATADKSSYLNKTCLTSLTELDVGIDTVGVINKGKPIVLVCHGKGILINDYNRILKALTPQKGAKFEKSEFNNLLNSFNGDIYTVNDVVKGNIKNPLGAYAVALDFEKVKLIESKYYKKKDFMENPLVLAEAGTLEYLEDFFDNYFVEDDENNSVGCCHPFDSYDSRVSLGYLLLVYDNHLGLLGSGLLRDFGCFVGVVVPETHVARK